MKTHQFLKSGALPLVALSVQLHAGEIAISPTSPPPQPTDDYVGGRGLLTTQGPTGLFINPTSGTMPAGAVTAQYCFFMPNNSSTDPLMVHGALLSYGATDWLEVSGRFRYVDVDNGSDRSSGGPMIRARLMKQDEILPELSIGTYMYFGDEEIYSGYLALFKSMEISKDGFLRSVGGHMGLRSTWIEDGPRADGGDAPVGYFGLEVEMPLRLYLVGEVSTYDEDAGSSVPYSFGVQWRAGGINVSAAMMEPGFDFVNEPSFFFGIGTQFKF